MSFEILVGWILRLGLNFGVINVILYGLKCDPAYPNPNPNPNPNPVVYIATSLILCVDFDRDTHTGNVCL